MKAQVAMAAIIWGTAGTALAAPDLTVSVAGASQAYAGGVSQTYTVTVVNVGNQTAPQVVTRVALPPGVSLVTYTGGCQVKANPSRLECVHYAHKAGFSRTISLTAAPPTSTGNWTFGAQVTCSVPENTTANNSGQKQTQLVAAPALPLAVTQPVPLNAELCWDAARTVASCQPYALDYAGVELLPGNVANTYDPSVNAVWSQGSGQNDLHIVSYDAGTGDQLAEFNLVPVSASCFEGTVVYSDVSPDTYNTRFCF
jgi:uncharacterized repeat protein (TIGR01451 family)